MLYGNATNQSLGVSAVNPPDTTIRNRPPTESDYIIYGLNHLWFVKYDTGPIPYEVYYLASKDALRAIWIKLYPQGGTGGGGDLRSDDGLIETVNPATNAINVYGGEPYGGDVTYINMYTNRLDAYTLYVNLKRSINQPLTNATATEGMYSLGGRNFMHNYSNLALGGDHNTWLGNDAGNLVMTTASDCTGIGYNALRDVDTALFCTAVGSNALANIDDGQYCIGIGYNAGVNLDIADSDDIMIGNEGVAGDLNTIRIGKMPTPNPLVPPGAGEQNKVFLAGVWNSPAVPAANTGLVIVDDSGQLYVDDLAPNSVVMTDVTGNPVAVKGAKGTVLTGRGIGVGDPAPTFLELKSAGGTVGITVIPAGPDVDCINLEVLPAAGGIATLTSDTGVVLPLLANVNVLGGDLINTDNLVANTVTVNLDRSTLDPTIHCELVTGMGAAGASIYKELWSSDGSILFDLVSDPTKIDIVSVGGGGGTLTHLNDNAGVTVTPVAGGITLKDGKNINTVAGPGAGELTINVTDNVSLLGWLHAALEVQAGGNLISTAGNLVLPLTSGTGTEGVIKFNGQRYMHMYGASASNKNLFTGYRSGNLTMTDNTATGNIGYGYATLEHLTSGTNNTGSGYASLNMTTSGEYNTGYGYAALQRLVTGAYNTALGRRAGYNYTGTERSNIAIGHVGVTGTSNRIYIGTDGTGDGEQAHCYIAGIRDSTAGTTPEMVVIGTDHKLSSQPIPSGSASTFQTDSGNATPAAGVLQIDGGYNIGTRGAGNQVLIDVDDSIQQSITNAAGTTGVYALGTRGANTYSTNRFMHAWGGGLGMTGYNTFLGYQSGRLNAAAIGLNNVGIGGLVLDAYTSAANNVAIGKNSMTNATSASNSTCVGSGSGSALTTGGSNLLLGLNSGNAYTTESNNITLAHGGVAADSRTMRLGYDTQWNWVIDKTHPNGYGTMTTTGTTSAYLYGAFNSNVDETAAPVYVDKTGKLGTNGGVSYAYHQAASIVDVTGDGTLYVFGTASPLVKDFDATGVVTVGGAGAPAYFTAPFPGKYFFSATITYDIPALPVPPPAPVIVSPLYLLAKKVGATATTSYMFATFIPKPLVGVAQQASEIVTAEIFLDKDETVRWACRVENMTKRIGIIHANVVAYGGLAYTCWATYFTGHRVG